MVTSSDVGIKWTCTFYFLAIETASACSERLFVNISSAHWFLAFLFSVCLIDRSSGFEGIVDILNCSAYVFGARVLHLQGTVMCDGAKHSMDEYDGCC